EEQGPGLPGLQERVRDLQAVEEPGALLPDVERGDRAEPELVLEQSAAAREVVVRRHGGEDDVVDLFLRNARVLEGCLGRADAEVARGGPRLDVVALLDAG